jgi:phosphoribosylformylglycinamidine (FGAM) synthase-like enzyme
MPDKDIYQSHGINEDEKKLLLESLGREPTITEIGIFSVMWSEHCSYKSSRYWLKELHTSGNDPVKPLLVTSFYLLRKVEHSQEILELR